MKRLTLLLLFLITAKVSAQWSTAVDTLTNGDFNDINPEIDHAGVVYAYYQIGSIVGQEWVVFERWTDSTDAISSVKFSGSTLKWDSSVVTISPARPGLVQKYPDVSTAENGTSIAAWQERTDSTWNIYYSIYSAANGQWSLPAALTNDRVDNLDVEVRPVSDSSFVLIWRRESYIVFSIYHAGLFSPVDTLTKSNTDSVQYDFAGKQLVWTRTGNSGNRFCLVAAIENFTNFSLSVPDTISADGDMSNPRFMINNGDPQRMFTFNLLSKGSYSAWCCTPYGNGLWDPEELAGSTDIDYLNAAVYAPPYIVASSFKLKRPEQLYSTNFYVWERRTAIDTSVVFYEAGSDSIQRGSFPSASSESFTLGNGSFTDFAVWQSDRDGKSHLYARDFAWNNTPVESPPSPATSFSLGQNYPNPFNPSTVIQFVVRSSGSEIRPGRYGFVTLKVYDVLGREVATLVDGRESAGTHSVVFNGSKYASGVYFYRLSAPGVNIVRKMLLEK